MTINGLFGNPLNAHTIGAHTPEPEAQQPPQPPFPQPNFGGDTPPAMPIAAMPIAAMPVAGNFDPAGNLFGVFLVAVVPPASPDYVPSAGGVSSQVTPASQRTVSVLSTPSTLGTSGTLSIQGTPRTPPFQIMDSRFGDWYAAEGSHRPSPEKAGNSKTYSIRPRACNTGRPGTVV